MEILSLIFMSKLTWITAIPFAVLIYFLTRKKIQWQWKDHIGLMLSPLIWQALIYVHPLGKSLSNYFQELIVLGLGICALYLASILVSPLKNNYRFPFLLVTPIVLAFTIYLLTPVLPE